MLTIGGTRRPPQIGKQIGAWPDQTAGSPCHRYSRPLAAIEVNDPPAVLSATRIEPLSRTNSIGAFPFLRQPAESVGLIENRPAPPHRNASRQLKSCKSPNTAKSEAFKPSKQRVIGAARPPDGFAASAGPAFGRTPEPLSRGIRRGPTSRGTRQRSAGQPEPRRRPYCRHRSWQSGHRARGSSRRAPPGRQA